MEHKKEKESEIIFIPFSQNKNPKINLVIDHRIKTDIPTNHNI